MQPIQPNEMWLETVILRIQQHTRRVVTWISFQRFFHHPVIWRMVGGRDRLLADPNKQPILNVLCDCACFTDTSEV